MKIYRNHGFTLLEMLVALTIFALVSAMVYGGQVAVLKAKQGVERQAEHLKRLQTAISMIERDIRQYLLRPVRDEFGDNQPAMVSADVGEYRLKLTRAGWQNPLGLPRSRLQRIAYGLQEEKLWRYSWPTLDRTQGSEPYRMVLLEGVRKLELRFLDMSGSWQSQWPKLGGDNQPLVGMPRAVELTIELDGWGSFRRLIPTAGGGVDMSEPVTVAEEKS